MNEARLIERFMDALYHDPQAAPPPGLDPELVDFVRELVGVRQAHTAPSSALEDRVLRRVLAATDRAGAPPPEYRPKPSTNGKQPFDKEKNRMTSLAFPLPRQRRSSHALRVALATVIALVVIALLLPVLVPDDPPSQPAAVYLSAEEAHMNTFERYITEAWNAGNIAILDEIVSQDVILYQPGLPDVIGPDALAELITQFHAQNADALLTIEAINAAEEDVRARVSLNGVAPAPIMYMMLVRFDDERIMELWMQEAPDGVITVGPGCTLRDAINAANTDEVVGACAAGQSRTADVIILDNIIRYTLVREEDNNTDAPNAYPSITSDIVIRGNGRHFEIDQEIENLRFFHVAAGGDLTLENMTFSGGASWNGGSVIFNKGTLVVRNCTFRDNGEVRTGGAIRSETGSTTLITDSTFTGNRAVQGGALYARSAQLTVYNSTFTGNSAESQGGAVFLEQGVLALIASSAFDGNWSDSYGGAIQILNSELQLADSTVTGNRAVLSGGALWNESNSNTVIMRSTITDNWTDAPSPAYQHGGAGAGIMNYRNATLMLIDSTVANNRAQDIGGGIYNQDNATLIITGSTITGNSAAVGGGIVSFDDARLTVENSTIYGNMATEYGGGLVSAHQPATLINSTITANDAPQAAGIGNGFTREDYPRTEGSLITLHNTISANDAGGDCVAYDAMGTFDGSANLDSDGTCPASAPLDGLADSLADNGGLTQTAALLDGSSALDAGDPAFCPTHDQRGARRDDACDIGAFELGGTFED